MMTINGIEIEGNKVAYDGCHKIYIIEDRHDLDEAKSGGYTVYDIAELEDIYECSCPLKFISNWNLDKRYIKQFEEAVFE